ncbi:MAG TPA: hypothetical protein VFF15_05845 [Flavobacteriaceae bacterium]|nr:hypothetical protein [Flavobacteriaceae bacterium]
MKNLVVLLVLLFVSAAAFAQDTQVQDSVKKTTDSVAVKAITTKDSTSIAFITSKKALIEADFNKADFLFRVKKSKRTQVC